MIEIALIDTLGCQKNIAHQPVGWWAVFFGLQVRSRTGRRSAERKKQSGGLFFSPRETPLSSTNTH